MDADEIFRKSRVRGREMSRRSLLMAVRYKLASWDTGVDVPRMFAALESGEVWSMRGVGKKTVHEWCLFVARKINGVAPHPLETECGNAGGLGIGFATVSLSNEVGMNSIQYHSQPMTSI